MNDAKRFLIVGLGNPGAQYQNTRHNIGFMVIEQLLDTWNIQVKTERSMKAVVGTGWIETHKVVIAQPTTYMNLSGEAVYQLSQYYKIPMEQLLVVCDDVAIPYGSIRLRPSGSDGGQKGIRSIIQSFGHSKDFTRLRVGVGSAPPKMDLADYVLSRFSPDERVCLPDILKTSAQAIISWMAEGSEKTMTAFNGLRLLP